MVNLRKYFSLLSVVLAITTVQHFADAQSTWTLKQCIDTAFKNNVTILQSQNALDLNTIAINQSKSNRLPTLNINASESFNTGRSVNPVSNQYATGTVFSNNFSLNTSVTLFSGFQVYNTIKQSQVNYLASKLELEAMKNDIALNIVNAYLQVLLSAELLRIAQSQLDGTKQQLENILQHVHVGKKSESDALQIQSQLAIDKLAVVNAQNQLKINKLTLQQLLNIPVSPKFEILTPDHLDSPLLSTDLISIGEAYSLALSLQPLIKSYKCMIKSSEYAIKIAKGGLYPRLVLSGNVYTNYSSSSKISNVTYVDNVQPIGFLQSNSNELVLSNTPTPVYSNLNYLFVDQIKNNFSQTISLSLTLPILSNYSVRNNIRKQKINLENTKLKEQIVQNNLRKNIEQAYLDVENASEKYNASKEQVAAAFVSSQNANMRYDKGMITASELLIEKNRYLKTQSDQIQAKYELIFRLKIIDFYKGDSLNF